MDMLIYALKAGKICVVDVSQMRGGPGLILSGLILRRIFDHNQSEFTEALPETIPTIAVVEEAQAVLGSGGTGGEGPYVEWVKEGRKYDLGAVLITQQPGSISPEILSQGDNWFVFHLLSAGDLQALKRANAHFSDDLLSALLNEPIEGDGIFWSSVGGKSYPIPVRVLSFEGLYHTLDPDYRQPPVETFAQHLREKFAQALGAEGQRAPAGKTDGTQGKQGEAADEADKPVDALETYIEGALVGFEKDAATVDRLRRNGLPWRGVQERLAELLPDVLDEQERRKVAYSIVPRAMDRVFGKDRWQTEKRPSKSSSGTTTWLVVKQ